MRQRRNYTVEEDQYIIRKVTEGSNNLSKAFREASEHLDRNALSIRNRWYYYLSKAGHNNSVNARFVTVGRNQVNFNRKVARIDTQQPRRISVNNTIWQQILTSPVGQ